MSLAHHELCFGCGSANLFGLQMDLEAEGDGVAGRFFVKQDHQGTGGVAHAGVVAGALEEAMGLALHARGVHGRVKRLEVDLLDEVPVGVFLDVEAHVADDLTAEARAHNDHGAVAEARAVFDQIG